MSNTPSRHSPAAIKANPAPDRNDYGTGAEYAEACRLLSEARGTFDEAASACTRTGAEQRRILFVEAYIANGGNATQAAKDAGFSEKTAYSQGHDLLKLPEIKHLIAKRQQELADKYALTTDSVIRALGNIVHLDPRAYFNPDGSLKRIVDLDDRAAAALASVEVDELREDGAVVGVTQKIKFCDKNSAIEKAMKHLGMFERDNAQKNDTIRDFLNQCSGKALPISSDE